MTAIRPLWLLDVDGVLSPIGGTYVNGYDFLLPHRGEDDQAIPFRPDVIRRLALLVPVFDFQWLTTWDADMVSDWLRVGLGPFPQHRRETAEGPRRWWKLNVVEACLDANPNRLVVWSDDEIRRRLPRGFSHPRLRTISPNKATGLTASHIDRATTWVSANGVAA